MMTLEIGGLGRPTSAPETQLRQAAEQLEGAFVQQLFQAMRGTVPDGGIVDGGSGEEIFTGMMDQHLAGQVPGRWEHGLAEALYRQLRGAMGESTTTESPFPVVSSED